MANKTRISGSKRRQGLSDKAQRGFAVVSGQGAQLAALQLQADQSPTVSRLSPLQRAATVQRQVVEAAGSHGAPSRSNGLPDELRSGMESLSGVSLEDVRVHRNSTAPVQVGAHAYAQGRDIHLAPGQEQHLPHEAWHVVQQAQGRVRPTLQVAGRPVNDDLRLEQEADRIGAAAMQRKANPTALAELPASFHGTLQRNEDLLALAANRGDLKTLFADNGAEVVVEWSEMSKWLEETADDNQIPDGKFLDIGQFQLSADGQTLKAITDTGYFDDGALKYIAAFLVKFMRQNGQIGFILDQAWFQTGEFNVVVDSNFYPNRSLEVGGLGFHKDTAGQNLFVNLLFNNKDVTPATEYIYDTGPDGPASRLRPDREVVLRANLPDELVKQIISSKTELDRRDRIEKFAIEGGIAQPNAYISWVDELIWHSSPSMSGRPDATGSDYDPASGASGSSIKSPAELGTEIGYDIGYTKANRKRRNSIAETKEDVAVAAGLTPKRSFIRTWVTLIRNPNYVRPAASTTATATTDGAGASSTTPAVVPADLVTEGDGGKGQ